MGSSLGQDDRVTILRVTVALYPYRAKAIARQHNKRIRAGILIYVKQEVNRYTV